uniref:GrpE protein homolog n=2 Tax=Tetraselmis chuii TaxID=63592 RepID=A0A7S1T8I4_9CHLO|mmetsp:Transcript_8861/g.15931  ORF Transcript_8861/g.15931 Transcript_8861/m.15931 type:complete len:326 (+) Transcript_8861:133-1110(+)|eukprot:CAMPEP_0177768640 /NCGR_PEP_ID=MMETSP0491_2-20121128/9834_1 /TAXON_ID=63592 /ORGANISM="Tetraselmis chuii, Strain PLY429" /LENGTH=325 /DNA_ID=CAMNT_0019285471 /DNA_START=122 /DNA_END=1099 /DNA_ORIENTATION=-
MVANTSCSAPCVAYFVTARPTARARLAAQTPALKTLRTRFPTHSTASKRLSTSSKVVVRNAEKDAPAHDAGDANDEYSGETRSEPYGEVEVNNGSTEEAGPALTGYAKLFAILRETTESGDDVEAAIASVEAEFVAMTESVNEVNAAVKLQESIALAAKEQYLRSTADFENFRKRSQIEKDALRDSVKGDVVSDFLPLVDNFELASKQLKLETEAEKKIDASYQAMYRQMVEIFKNLGVTAVETVGKPFDPEKHEAIMQEESTEVEDGLILDEFRRGFMLGSKLLRPAMVKVAINHLPKTEAAPSDSGSGEVAGKANEQPKEEAK